MAAGAVVAYAGISQAKQAISTTEELAKATISLHENLGLSVKEAGEWAAVAKTRGADTTKLGMAFKTLAGQITQARDGSESSIQSFKKLGFSQADIQKASRNTHFLLLKTSEGLHNLAAGSDKAAISGKLFGRGWQTIQPVLRDGSKELQRQLDLANKYGATFGGKSLKSVYDLIKAQREMQLAQLGLQITFTEKIAPALMTVGLWLAKLINQFREGKGPVGAFVGVVEKVVGFAYKWRGAILGAVGAYVALKTAIAGAAAVQATMNAISLANPYVAAAAAVIAVGIAIGVAYQKSATFRGIVNDIGAALKNAFLGSVEWIKGAVHWLTTAARNVGHFVSSLIPVKIAVFAVSHAFELLMVPVRVVLRFLGTVASVTFQHIGDVIGLVTHAIGHLGDIFGDVVGIVSHLLRGDFAGAWRNAKQLVGDVISGIVEIVRDGFRIITHGVHGLARIIGGAFSGAWDLVEGVFKTGVNAVIDFLEVLRKAINLIPGVELGPIREKKGPRPNKSGHGPGPSSAANRYAGGPINRPMAIVGEEAPQHPEWVVATNPAYRRQNVGYWMQAGHDLGIPGFALGGLLPSGPIQGLFGSTGGFDLPTPHLPEPFKKLGPWLIHKVTAWIKDQVSGLFGGGAQGQIGGSKQLMMMDGHPVATWIGNILYAARKAGVPFRVSSGYRSLAEQTLIYNSGVRPAAIPGTSHHEGTVYPSGAVDVSPGAHALAHWLAHTRWRRMLVYAGAKDPVHFSHPYGGGYRLGGRLLPGFAGGGVIGGKVSWFGGGSSAGGKSTSQPGVALNLHPGTEAGWNNPTTQGWMAASRAGHPVIAATEIAGHHANLPIIDLGPAASTGRAIDVTVGGVRKLGFTTGNFPTDAYGRAVILGGGGRGAHGGAGGHKWIPRMGVGKAVAVSVAGLKASPLLPAAAGLEPRFQKMLSAPGIGYASKMAIAEAAAEQGGGEAAIDLQVELLQRNKHRLQKQLSKVNRELSGKQSPKARARSLAHRKALEEQLRGVEGGLTQARSAEGEEEETPAQQQMREAVEAQTKAAEEDAAALKEHSEAIKELEKTVKEQMAFAKSEVALSGAVATRAFADFLSGYLGPKAFQRAQVAGSGTVGTAGAL